MLDTHATARLLGLLAASLACGHPLPARAKPPEGAPHWAVIPVSTGDRHEVKRTERTAKAVIAALAKRGEHVDRLDAQTAEFRKRHSHEPRKVTPNDIDQFLARAERVRQAYAFERRAAALREMSGALEWGRKARASLMRDTRVASRFLDTCLINARHALEHKHDTSAAKRLIRACLLEAVDVPHTQNEHPPEIVALIREVQSELESGPGSKLVVRSMPEGCDVYINGRFSAKTNAELTRPLRGQYPIQVECPDNVGSGRVHLREIGDEVVTLDVDTAFEATIRTGRGDSLRLQFADAQQLQQHASDYAGRVGAALAAEHVLLVTAPQAGRAEVYLLQGPTPRPQASITLSRRGRPAADTADAVRVLVEAAGIPPEHRCTEAVLRVAERDGEQAARAHAPNCSADANWQPPTVPQYRPEVVALFEGVIRTPEPADPPADAEAAPAPEAQALSLYVDLDAPADHPGGAGGAGGAGPWPYVVMGAGGALLGGALVTGLMVADAEQELIDAGCDAGCDPRYDSTRADGRNLQVTTNLLLASGLTGLVGGALWWWLDAGAREAPGPAGSGADNDTDNDTDDTLGATWSPRLDCAADYCGASVHGSF